MFDGIDTDEIFSYVEQSLDEENFLVYGIRLKENHSLYSGNIVCVKVQGKDHNNFFKTLDLVVKTKLNDCSMAAEEQKDALNWEIFMYKEVFPLMDRLFCKYARCGLDCLPTCYYTVSTPEKVAVIFNDLSKLGYSQREQKLPMNLSHLKMILHKFAKLHAIFFALREQKNEEFERVLSKFPSHRDSMYFKPHVTKMLNKGIHDVCNIFASINARHLRDRFSSITQKGAAAIIEDVLSNVPKEWVMVHGDSWNDSFLFKYEGDDRETPRDLKIISWQYSTLHSPVLDVLQSIYSVSSKLELEHFQELLNVYYSRLSFILRAVGCDANKLFPFSTLMEHLKKYSAFTLILVTAGLLMEIYHEYISSPDQIDGECNEEETSRWRAMCEERLVAVVEHYCEFVLGDNVES